MRILVTGMGGTVAPRFAEHARAAGHEVVAWSRDQVSPNDPPAVAEFIAAVVPQAIVHMAFGAESWAGQLASECRSRGIPFVFTSTTMVFGRIPDGPYTIHSGRTATDDYGQYKIRCEDAIWAANPAAMVARLGYQIDAGGTGNNMVAHRDAESARTGQVLASTRWLPACAFLDDTATALLGLVETPQAGLHHLDANAQSALSYYEIVSALAMHLGRDWVVVPTQDPVHDQRLIDSPRIRGLGDRLSGGTAAR